MHLRDVTNGTSVADMALEKYQSAWEARGFSGADGLYPDLWMVKQNVYVPARDPGFTLWGATFMNSWNCEYVRSKYEDQAFGFITNINGQVRVNQPLVGQAIRQKFKDRPAHSVTAAELAEAKKEAKEQLLKKGPGFPYTKPILGYALMWTSELGKKEELEGLLSYVDERLSPSWERGGLYYPRCDEVYDQNMDVTHIDPFTGNAAVGFARLNIEDGQKKLWDDAWTKDELARRPYISGVSLAEDVDFARGTWDEEANLLLLTARTWNGETRTIKPVFRNLPAGSWKMFVDGQLKSIQDVAASGEVSVEVKVGKNDVDVVALKQ
jgi:hypothetical protein